MSVGSISRIGAVRPYVASRAPQKSSGVDASPSRYVVTQAGEGPVTPISRISPPLAAGVRGKRNLDRKFAPLIPSARGGEIGADGMVIPPLFPSIVPSTAIGSSRDQFNPNQVSQQNTLDVTPYKQTPTADMLPQFASATVQSSIETAMVQGNLYEKMGWSNRNQPQTRINLRP
jgi:hypothetical protein